VTKARLCYLVLLASLCAYVLAAAWPGMSDGGGL